MHPSITIRSAELDDGASLHSLFSCPRVIHGTLQLPFPSLDMWKKRFTSQPDGTYNLVACINQNNNDNNNECRDDGDVREVVVGMIGLHTFPLKPRRKHVGSIGMEVRDE
eukprot:TRINITY_DN9385_c1_g1_i1.p1 TRINITY_DN9385_c1_g1~~TRINITY_DN9385_c1_g1_i1.p1  ORF type:complete len:110 (+),score=28.06 TRINITY_DN9385_c1_g1_i1:197-526(+)